MSRPRRTPQLDLFVEKRPTKKRLGRPRIHDVGIAHRRRPSISPKIPVHVTLRMEARVWNLRSRRAFRIIQKALFAASTESARVVHYSVQGNHMHLLVEADDKRALSRAMTSLATRIGLGLNALMGTRGRVIAHRYHARSLRTPTEVYRALGYLRHNFRHHHAEVTVNHADPYASQTALAPRTWLLSTGWRRGGPS